MGSIPIPESKFQLNIQIQTLTPRIWIRFQTKKKVVVILYFHDIPLNHLTVPFYFILAP